MRTAKEIKKELFTEATFETAVKDVEIAVQTAIKEGHDYAFCGVDNHVRDAVVKDAKASGYRVFLAKNVIRSTMFLFSWGAGDFTEYPEV